MPKSMTCKSPQDRYELLQRQFNATDNKNLVLSGVGGDLSELED